ncbi:hypothetical protein GGI04_002037 [Coemansia thaxteri]|nr:hypothetical protein GGI04_002037 [Coemansia thaxteri]KAJ2468220.1 hypothetical protein GGI02_003771 [Coemansia sp. RSA 2322]
MLLNRFSRLVYLGDSNADTGNVFSMTNGTGPMPSHVYWNGRYSNGMMWVDHLNSFGPSESIVLAHGCATIDNSIVSGTVAMPDATSSEVPSLTDQISLLLAKVGKLSPEDLVFVFVGSNDLNSMITDGPPYIKKQALTLRLLATRLQQEVERLCLEVGARNAIVMSVRPREDYPGVLALNDPAKLEFTRQATSEFNAMVCQDMAELQERLGSSYRIGVFDTYAFQKRITQDPAAAGIDPDLQTPCNRVAAESAQAPDKQIVVPLSNPETKLFVDDFHLAKRAQGLLAAEVVRYISLMLATEQCAAQQ